MKTYTMSYHQSINHVPDHPERTARRSGSGLNFDITYQVWPNRASLARSIRMQEKRAPHPSDWKPYVALTDGEGY